MGSRILEIDLCVSIYGSAPLMVHDVITKQTKQKA